MCWGSGRNQQSACRFRETIPRNKNTLANVATVLQDPGPTVLPDMLFGSLFIASNPKIYLEALFFI
jgi:hypothetical protein